MRKRSEILGLSTEEQFQDIYSLIKQAKYADAFDLLETMEDPRAQQWLAKLEDASPGVLKSVGALKAAGRYETARFVLELSAPTGKRWLSSLQPLKPKTQSDNLIDSGEKVSANLFQTVSQMLEQEHYIEVIRLLRTKNDPLSRSWLAKLNSISPGLVDQTQEFLGQLKYKEAQSLLSRRLDSRTSQAWLESFRELEKAFPIEEEVVEDKAESPEKTNVPLQEVEANPINPQSRLMKRCPYCAEDILAEAIVCRYCGRDLEAKPVPKKVNNGEVLRSVRGELARVQRDISASELALRRLEEEISKTKASWGGFILGMLVLVVLLGLELFIIVILPITLIVLVVGSLYRGNKRGQLQTEKGNVYANLDRLHKKHASLTQQIIELEANL